MNLAAKVLWTLVLISILSVGMAAIIRNNNVDRMDLKDVFKSFSDVYEIKEFIESHRINADIYPMRGVVLESSMASPLSKSSQLEYSSTNVQVEGIDEQDYVKTDGRYIYVADYNTVYIVNAYPPEDMKLESVINISNNTIQGIYVYDDMLILLLLKSIYFYRYGVVRESAAILPYRYQPISMILIYDVSNKGEPVLYKNITIDGYIVESRLYNGKLYVVSSAEPYIIIFGEDMREPNVEYKLPTFWMDGDEMNIRPEDIYYITDAKDFDFNYISVYAVDLETMDLNGISILAGYSAVLYMSYENIYLAQPYYAEEELGNNTLLEAATQYTKIFRIGVDGLELVPEAVGMVVGSISSQLQMDEYKGYLRVSTFTWIFKRDGWTSSTNIFILDMNMEVVGSLTGLGKSEMLYSTRFLGDYAYLVTYRIIDPFFVVDLSDPENPHVLGELKIPGFSSMLQPINDRYVVGIGLDEDRVLKISLFDVSDPASPSEVDKLVINGSHYSEALYTHRAILKVPNMNVLAIPIGYYEVLVVDRNGSKIAASITIPKLAIFRIEDGSIELEGIVDAPYNVSDIYRYYGYTRGVYIEGYIYVVNNHGVAVYTYPDLENVEEIYF